MNEITYEVLERELENLESSAAFALRGIEGCRADLAMKEEALAQINQRITQLRADVTRMRNAEAAAFGSYYVGKSRP